MHRYPWFQIDETAFVDKKVSVKKGIKTFVSWGCYVGDQVSLGSGVLVGPNVTIISRSHQFVKDVLISQQKATNNKIIIEDDVFIGAGAVILGGAIIKSGAVIGAGSIVLENTLIDCDEIWAGNPAKKIGERK